MEENIRRRIQALARRRARSPSCWAAVGATALAIAALTVLLAPWQGPRPIMEPEKWMRSRDSYRREYESVLKAVPELREGRQARIAFFIMAHGADDVTKVQRAIPWLYHPDHLILVHMDRKTAPEDVQRMQAYLDKVPNARVLTPGLDVSWGGFSITLAALFGLSTLVQWSKDWDYFMNLSASDFPLLSATEMAAVLGAHTDRRINFVTGGIMYEQNRAERFVDDQGLYRNNLTRKAGRAFMYNDGKTKVIRPLPTLFHLFKGEFWVTLHRSFCEYISESPDNVARSLQAYFAKFRISDESFFQTTLCHPQVPVKPPMGPFPVYNNNLRYINWPAFDPSTQWVLHPDPVEVKHVDKVMRSGALFARKFELGVSDAAIGAIEALLGSGGRRREDRIRRVLKRAGLARGITGRTRFCHVPASYNLQNIIDNPVDKQMAPKKTRRQRRRR